MMVHFSRSETWSTHSNGEDIGMGQEEWSFQSKQPLKAVICIYIYKLAQMDTFAETATVNNHLPFAKPRETNVCFRFS